MEQWLPRGRGENGKLLIMGMKFQLCQMNTF